MSKFLYASGGRSFASASTSYYCGLAGGAGTSGSAEPSYQAKVYDSFTWANLYVSVSANTWGSAVTVKSRKNTADGNQSVSITASTTGEFEDTSNSDSLVNGDLIAVVVTTPSGSGSVTVDSISTLLTNSGDVALHFQSGGPASSTIGAGVTAYEALHGPKARSTTEVRAQVTCRNATTLSKLRCYVSSNSGGTGSLSVKLRKNGADGTQALSISAAATGEFEDTSNTDSIAAGDEVNYVLSNGENNSVVVQSLQCRSSSGLMTSTNLVAATFTGTTAYYPLGSLSNSSTVEAQTQVAARTTALRFGNLCFSTPTNTRSVATTVALRKNASTVISLSVAASSTGLFEDTSSESTPSAVSDDYNFSISSAAGSGSLTMGTVSIGQLPLATVTVAGAPATATAAALAGAVQIGRTVPGETAAAVAAANAGVVAAVQVATIAGVTATAAAAAGAGVVATFPAAIVVGVTATAGAAANAATVAAVGTIAIAGETAAAAAAAGEGAVQVARAVPGETAAAAAAALLAVVTALSIGHPHPAIPAPAVRLGRLPGARVHARRSGDV